MRAVTKYCSCNYELQLFYIPDSLLEFNNKETQWEPWSEDKCVAIREFFMKMNENNGRCRKPLPYVSVDKTLYPYRERICMKQYNPSKLAKYGLLYQSLCDTKVPYTYSTVPYAGKSEMIGVNDYYVKGETFPLIDT